MIRHLASIYRKLPIKPFRGTAKKLFDKYKSGDRNKVVVASRDGVTYELNLNEAIDSSIYYDGCFEPMTVAIINKYVKPGMTVLDIGANVGCHTFRLAKLVGTGGKVIAFEPMAIAFTKFSRNLELNNFTNIILEKMALSNEDRGNQALHFYASWPLSSDSHDKLHPFHHGLKSQGIAEVITLDDYINKKGIEKVDFIKLDVDGYEYKVILGAVNSIRKLKPVMIIEFGRYTLAEFGDGLEDLANLLASLGYSFYSEKDLQQYDTVEALLKDVLPDETINVLCKPS